MAYHLERGGMLLHDHMERGGMLLHDHLERGGMLLHDHLERGGMLLHDAVKANCKNCQTTAVTRHMCLLYELWGEC